MKCFVPEISWHNRDPVYSLDIQPRIDPNEKFYRLASGGADSHVVIWHVSLTHDNEDTNQFASFQCAADLQRHQKSVNVVRFSPNGLYLASGDDDGVIIIWKMRLDQDPPELLDNNSEKDKEIWITFKMLRGHLQDVYDLAWSPDSTQLISGSIDNSAVLWEVEKGKKICILGDHKGFVQGVAWDPKGKYIATLSTDRMLRVFDAAKKRLVGKCSKLKLPWTASKEKEEKNEKENKSVSEDKEKKDEKEKSKVDKDNKDEKEKLNKMFHNDTLKTFFRRLNFSPGGELLITPCGIIQQEDNKESSIDATYVFTRSSFSKPAVHLPSPGQYTIAVRCSPITYRLRGSNPGLFSLPYRIVYAVATRSTVVLYDTEQKQAFGFVSNIHYTGLTDVTWSPDGRLIVISSSEGFCSVITFDENEIGIPYKKDDEKVSVNGSAPLPQNSDEKMDIQEEKPNDNEKQKLEDQSAISKETQKLNSDSSSKENQVQETNEKQQVINESVECIDIIKNSETKSNKNEVCHLEEPMDVDCDLKSDNPQTPEKQINLPVSTPKKDQGQPESDQVFKTPDKAVKTPVKVRKEVSDAEINNSPSSKLSLSTEDEEDGLISQEEQARKLMSPYRDSPVKESPSRRVHKISESSPITPKSGRRVNLTTLSSPKTKRKL